MEKYAASERIFLDGEIERISTEIAEDVEQMVLGCAIREIDGIDDWYLGYDCSHGIGTTALIRCIEIGTKDERFEVIDIIQHGK
jgi:hypothetical protein